MKHNKLLDLYWAILYSLRKEDAMLLYWVLPDLELTILGHNTLIRHITW